MKLFENFFDISKTASGHLDMYKARLNLQTHSYYCCGSVVPRHRTQDTGHRIQNTEHKTTTAHLFVSFTLPRKERLWRVVEKVSKREQTADRLRRCFVRVAQLRKILFPSRVDMILFKVRCCLTSVTDVTVHLQGLAQLTHLLKPCQTPLEHVINSPTNHEI